MKNFITIMFHAICLLFAIDAIAQCSNADFIKRHPGKYYGPKFPGIYTQIQDQSIFFGSESEGIDKGEYFEIELTMGNTYNITGGGTGAHVTVLRPPIAGNQTYSLHSQGSTAVGHSFPAPITGIYRILITNNICTPFGGITSDPILRISCTTCTPPPTINYGDCNNSQDVNAGGFVNFAGQTNLVPVFGNFPFDNTSQFGAGGRIEGVHEVYRNFTATSSSMRLNIKDFEVLNRSGDVKADGVFVMVYPAGCSNSQVIAKKYFNVGSISGTNEDEMPITGLNVGTNYIVRFCTDAGVDYSRTGATGSYTGIFNWVKFNPTINTAAPGNDFCINAYTLTPVNNNACSVPRKARLTFAQSSGANTCDATTPNLVDVFYKFIATSTKHKILIQGKNAELLVGNDCSNLTSVGCLKFDTTSFTGIHNLKNLTIGTTYYLKVYGLNIFDPINPFETFDICVFGETVTCNDPVATLTTRCIDANFYEATVNITQMGSSPTINITNNLGQPIISNISTTGNYVIGPISNTTGSLQVTIVNTNNTDCNVVLNATTNCQAAPIANDECTAAYVLPLGNNTCSQSVAGFTTGSTKSTNAPDGSCITTSNTRDIWFESTNNSGTTKSVIIQFGTGTAQQYRYEIYKTSNNCSNLGTSLVCGSVGFTFDAGDRRLQRIDSVANGEKIYVRIWTGSTTAIQNGTMSVCAFIAPIQPYTCALSTSVPVNSSLVATNSASFNNIGASLQEQQCNPQNTPILFSTDAFGLYHHFTATATKHVIKYFNKQSVFGNNNDLETKVFKEASCGAGSRINIACGTTDSVVLSNLTIGDQYRIYTYNNLPENRTSYSVAVLTVPLEATNDNCNTATVLTTTATCSNPVLASTFGATTSSQTACSGSNDDDVWFRFTATAIAHRITLNNISLIQGNSTNLVIQAFEGSCNTLLSLNSCNTNVTQVDLLNLTIGTTYFFRVHTADASSRVLFNVCVSNVPPPSNNECTNAITVPVTSFNCTQTTVGTTLAATQSLPRCAGTGVAPVYDVWYSFIATATAHSISATSDHYVELYSGTCNTLSSIACGNESIVGSSLTIGNTYFVRVYKNINPGNFTLCVATLPPIPANNTCTNRVVLTPSSNTSNNWTSSTTIGATRDTGSCNNPNEVDIQDVWFSFTANSNKTVIDLRNVFYPSQNATGTINMQVYTGSCTNLNSVYCKEIINDGQAVNTIPGTTYYVRLYTNAFSNINGANFDISIRRLNTPVNDEPVNAITLLHNIVNIPTTNSIEGATGTSANCFGNTENDVWFKFIAKNAEVQVNIINNGGTLAYQILDNNLTNVGCFSGITNATIGNTYYVRVWDMNTAFNPAIGNNAAFSIGISGGLPTTNIYTNNTAICETNSTLNSTASGNWLTLQRNGNLVFSILDSESLGTISSNIYVDSANAAIRKDANNVEYLGRNFTITPQTQPNNAIRVVFYFTAAEWQKLVAANDGDNNDVSNISDLRLTKFGSNICTNTLSAGSGSLLTPIAFGNVGVNYYLVFDFPSFSTAFLHGGNAALNSGTSLPVVCTNFTIQQKLQQVQLSWSTASATNNKGFEIERSIDGNRFNTIAFVTGITNSSTINNYTFIDQTTATGVYFYRIKQVDLNNTFSYICNTKKITVQQKSKLYELYPNPAKNFIYLKSNTNVGEQLTVQIIDLSGKVIHQLKHQAQSQPISIQNLHSGSYFLKVITQFTVEYLPFIKH
jgi:hypothetical protein